MSNQPATTNPGVGDHRTKHDGVPRRRRPTRPTNLAAAVVGAALTLSGCALPFGDDGDDISAEVGVSGASGNELTSETGSASRDDVVSTTEAPIPVEETPTTLDPGSQGDEDTVTPFISVDTRFDGYSTSYLGIEIELGDFIVTNQTIEEYTGRLDPTTDDRILIVELAVTNPGTGNLTLPEELFGIELVDGEHLPPLDLRATDGDSMYAIQPGAKATERVLLAFEDRNLTGASFVISEAGTVPLHMPLDGEVSQIHPFVYELGAQPAVSDLAAPSLWSGCDYLWTGEVVGARAVLDGVDGSRLERAALGMRWIAIELQITNDTPAGNEFFPCNESAAQHSSFEPRLVVDGAATAAASRAPLGGIDQGVSTTLDYWFQIPADTPDITLTDVEGNVLASWTLDLVTLPGED